MQIIVCLNPEFSQHIIRNDSYAEKVKIILHQICGYSEEEANQIQDILKSFNTGRTNEFFKRIAVNNNVLKMFSDILDITWSKVELDNFDIKYITALGNYNFISNKEEVSGIFEPCKGSMFNSEHYPTPDQIIDSFDPDISVFIKR